MDTAIGTPVQTPKKPTSFEATLSTPLLVPPTPLLKELGYGTGKIHYPRSQRIYLEKSTEIGDYY